MANKRVMVSLELYKDGPLFALQHWNGFYVWLEAFFFEGDGAKLILVSLFRRNAKQFEDTAWRSVISFIKVSSVPRVVGLGLSGFFDL